jgi:hypothetical protein
VFMLGTPYFGCTGPTRTILTFLDFLDPSSTSLSLELSFRLSLLFLLINKEIT